MNSHFKRINQNLTGSWAHDGSSGTTALRILTRRGGRGHLLLGAGGWVHTCPRGASEPWALLSGNPAARTQLPALPAQLPPIPLAPPRDTQTLASA